MKTSFIIIAVTTLISTSSFSKDCSQLNGTYDFPSMAQSCTESGIGYFPGDDSPLYTFFPGYSTESRNGYMEANSKIEVQASNNCKNISISYLGAKKGQSMFDPQEIVTMTFKVSKLKKGKVIISSKEIASGCDMGLCGRSKEISTLTLSKSNDELKLNVLKKNKGFIYFVPFKNKQTLNCSFPQI